MFKHDLKIDTEFNRLVALFKIELEYWVKKLNVKDKYELEGNIMGAMQFNKGRGIEYTIVDDRYIKVWFDKRLGFTQDYVVYEAERMAIHLKLIQLGVEKTCISDKFLGIIESVITYVDSTEDFLTAEKFEDYINKTYLK